MSRLERIARALERIADELEWGRLERHPLSRLGDQRQRAGLTAEHFGPAYSNPEKGAERTQDQMVEDAEADRQAARDGYNPGR